MIRIRWASREAAHLITVEEAADLLVMSRPYVNRLVLSGELPVVVDHWPQLLVHAADVTHRKRQMRARANEALRQLGRSIEAEYERDDGALIPAQYRSAITVAVTQVVRERWTLDEAVNSSGLPPEAQEEFRASAAEHLNCLDADACNFYRLRDDETRDWVRDGRPY